MRDAFNTPIKVSDVVVYAVRQGSKMWLNRLCVTEVCNGYVRGYDLDDVRMRYKTIWNLSTCVVTYTYPGGQSNVEQGHM